MDAVHLHDNESGEVFKLLRRWTLPTFCVVVILATADATARGDHAGAHHTDSNSSSSYAGDHGQHGSGHRHFDGDHEHFGDGHRHFDSDHGHLGGGHIRFGSDYKHIGDDHRRLLGGDFRFFGGFGGGYNFAYPLGYYYPRHYSYSYPSYSLHRPEYFSPPSYIGGYNYPSSYSGSSNTYRYNSTDARYPDTTTGVYSTNDLGWRLLAQSNPRAALDVFATQAGQFNSDGVPKVGYALSAAMQGDLNKAAWAMRRAFSIDPDSLHYLEIEASLRASIDVLLAEYHDQLKYAQGNRHFDVVFMIAALNYLIHDNAAARVAVEKLVVKLGDDSPGAQNLRRLVFNNKY
jgi:hypothetical protein